MILSYQEALRYLYDNLPMFQRLGPAAIKRDLSNTLKLCAVLGDPHKTFKSLHVAGTNGKGSTCHMLASVFQAAGYRTGLYTSPHLKEFTERIKIDGREVSQAYVLDFVNRIKPAIEEIGPSFFEITVAMAFDYFAQQGVDVAVIETGLGGRLDSTNVITPIISVITNISWDHKDLLGETLPQIATEKAGIIKHGVPVVISERQPSVQDVFIRKARDEQSDIFFASDAYAVSGAPDSEAVDILKNDEVILPSVALPLKGLYQQHNVPAVVQTIDLLRTRFDISDRDLKVGLENTVINTGLKGRWQILQSDPLVVCDTGHNESGIREVLRQIERQKRDQLFMILGMVKDKDVNQVLSLLPADAIYYFCQAKIPRAMDAGSLQEQATLHGLKGEVVPDVNEALRRALVRAKKSDLIFIGGSTYVVAELHGL